MRRSSPAGVPHRGQVQDGNHYAMHTLQGEPSGPRDAMVAVNQAEMLEREKGVVCHGAPTMFHYTEGGGLWVWPLPADGWRVFSEVSGKDVTP